MRLSAAGGEGRSQEDSAVFGRSDWRSGLPLTELEEAAGGAGVAGTHVQFQAC